MSTCFQRLPSLVSSSSDVANGTWSMIDEVQKYLKDVRTADRRLVLGFGKVHREITREGERQLL